MVFPFSVGKQPYGTSIPEGMANGVGAYRLLSRLQA